MSSHFSWRSRSVTVLAEPVPRQLGPQLSFGDGLTRSPRRDATSRVGGE